jgi:hypothetical protein
MVHQLPTEVLADVIRYLDPPSAVCFALTSHTNFDAVLFTCEAARLEDVCPKDVRTPMPKAIEAQAYNILTLHEDHPVPIWKDNSFEYYMRLKNFHWFPRIEDDQLPAGYTCGGTMKDILREHLAFIRHAEWSLLRKPYVKLGTVRVQTILSIDRGLVGVLIPTEECEAYMDHQFKSLARRRYGTLEHQVELLMSLWSRDIVESLEFMVLRDRLGERWMKMKLELGRTCTRSSLQQNKPISIEIRQGVVRYIVQEIAGYVDEEARRAYPRTEIDG